MHPNAGVTRFRSMTYVVLVLGLVFLVAGAELLVRGASAVAVRTGLSPIVIGLTVVAFGTSTPELAVSVGAGRGDQAGLALGNVVGSNIFNVLAVLGISAFVGGGLVVAQKIVRIDVPLMILASILLLGLAADGSLGRGDGLVLVAGIVVYTVWTVRTARSDSAAVSAEYDEAFGSPPRRPLAVDVGFVIGGIALLVLGSEWMVGAASDIAADFGVSDLVIGLTVVAAGTSTPELATSVVAALRGERDIAVGNVVGSNLFNILAVLGVSSIVSPDGLPVGDTALRSDLPIMVAVAVACLPVFFNGYAVKRWEGAVFALYYVAYVTFLILDQTGSSWRDDYAAAMLGFVAPLTILTLAVVTVRAVRARSSR